MLNARKHKTSQYGSAEIVLSETEEKVLRAYMMYARPFASKCRKETCPVFIGVSNQSSEDCCAKIPLWNITAIVRKTSVAAGISSVTVTTRMLRRSTVSKAWEKNTDPSFRQELSQLAGHSYETARSYNAIYEADEQSRRVVNKLEQYRR